MHTDIAKQIKQSPYDIIINIFLLWLTHHKHFAWLTLLTYAGKNMPFVNFSINSVTDTGEFLSNSTNVNMKLLYKKDIPLLLAYNVQSRISSIFCFLYYIC